MHITTKMTRPPAGCRGTTTHSWLPSFLVLNELIIKMTRKISYEIECWTGKATKEMPNIALGISFVFSTHLRAKNLLFSTHLRAILFYALYDSIIPLACQY